MLTSEPIEAIHAIQEWTEKTCTDENLKMGDYLTEEIYGRVTRFINYMLEAPNTIDDIRKKIPSGLSCASKTKNALTQSEFNTMVSYETYGAKFDDSVLSLLHDTMECYIYKLISEGAKLAKNRGSEELNVGDVNTIRLKYFPVKDDPAEPELGGFFDLVMDKKSKSKKSKSKKSKSKKSKSKRCPKGKRKNKKTRRCVKK
jgi:hypothetical protein